MTLSVFDQIANRFFRGEVACLDVHRHPWELAEVQGRHYVGQRMLRKVLAPVKEDVSSGCVDLTLCKRGTLGVIILEPLPSPLIFHV